jgi:5,10-methylenetetrahydromethanopterin reductase
VPSNVHRRDDDAIRDNSDTHVSKWDCVKFGEDLGYDRAWVPDSQMIWSDCYATLALAAANTKRIQIGTGVAIPGTRIAPVTAHSIASINQLAPGRVFLGIGRATPQCG